MGDEEQQSINAQLATMTTKFAKMEGAFLATGFWAKIGSYLCASVLVLAGGIALHAFNKIETHDQKLAEHSQSIAVIKTKETEYERWRDSVDDKFKRVVFKK